MPELKEVVRTTKKLELTLTQEDLQKLFEEKLGHPLPECGLPQLGVHRYTKYGRDDGPVRPTWSVSCAADYETVLHRNDEIRITLVVREPDASE